MHLTIMQYYGGSSSENALSFCWIDLVGTDRGFALYGVCTQRGNAVHGTFGKSSLKEMVQSLDLFLLSELQT